MQRIRAGEPALDVIEEVTAAHQADFRDWLMKECPNQVASYDARMRDIAMGTCGARNCWHSLSHTQRRALTEASRHGGKLVRVGKEYRHAARHQPYIPIYVATVRVLCAHELMAWDGGAFDPEAVAVVTERGSFVLKVAL
jgi:hypothetical protein